jgi:hypothetical protein
MDKKLPQARWWAVRPARNLKGASYTCPFCRAQLHGMSYHALIAPEGDTARRRHAHTACVQRARERGILPSYDDWRATQPRRPGLVRRLLRRG